jgi:hypothetical protein
VEVNDTTPSADNPGHGYARSTDHCAGPDGLNRLHCQPVLKAPVVCAVAVTRMSDTPGAERIRDQLELMGTEKVRARLSWFCQRLDTFDGGLETEKGLPAAVEMQNGDKSARKMLILRVPPGELTGKVISSGVLTKVIWPQTAIQDSSPYGRALTPAVGGAGYPHAVTNPALEPAANLAPRGRQAVLNNAVRVSTYRSR